MGGRGASSGTSKKGNPYGSQYKTLLVDGNVKYISKKMSNAEALMETQTKGRVYALVNNSAVKSVIYFDNNLMRMKTIDLNHSHNGIMPHVHHGYFHNEFDGAKGASKLNTKEQKLVDNILKRWQNHIKG